MRGLIISSGIILALSVGSAVGLNYLRSDLFPIEWALPATITFFTQFALLGRTLKRRSKPVDEERIRRLLDEAKSKPNKAWDWLGELLVFGVFLVIGVFAGTLSGAVWWAVGGNTIRTFADALMIGAIFGGGAIVILFGGV